MTVDELNNTSPAYQGKSVATIAAEIAAMSDEQRKSLAGKVYETTVKDARLAIVHKPHFLPFSFEYEIEFNGRMHRDPTSHQTLYTALDCAYDAAGRIVERLAHRPKM